MALVPTSDAVDLQQSQKQHKPLAGHLLVLMVCGIFTKLQFQNSSFHFKLCKNLHCTHLYPLLWEGVQLLEGAGPRVVSVTADGASQNRSDA